MKHIWKNGGKIQGRLCQKGEKCNEIAQWPSFLSQKLLTGHLYEKQPIQNIQ